MVGTTKRPRYLRWWLVTVDAAVHMLRDDGMMIAGHLAFLSLLTLFPFFIFLISTAGFFGQTELGARFVDLILGAMPPEVNSVLAAPVAQVIEDPGHGILTFSAVFAAWTASAGIEGARAAVNRAFGLREALPFWRTRLESLLLIIISPGLVIMVMAILVVLPVIWAEVRNFVDIPFTDNLDWASIRALIMLIITLQTVFGLFYILPARKMTIAGALPGALLVTAAWLLIGSLFSNVVGRLGQHAVVYAGLANIVVTLLFFYVLAVAFVFGAEINAAIARTKADRAPPAGANGADKGTPD